MHAQLGGAAPHLQHLKQPLLAWLAGNVMVPLADAAEGAAAAQPSMTFIDFEYSEYAPRGFDWGNHFCE